jgi:GNAT superfamily N-acetyltransferase
MSSNERTGGELRAAADRGGALTFRIRSFEPDDAEALSQLILLTVRTSNAKDYRSEALSRIEAEFSPSGLQTLAGQRQIFVAMEGAAIVGTASVAGNWVHAVFVHPLTQRQGLGRKLMDTLESYARTHGARWLGLYASVGAVPFYRSLGWRIEREDHTEDIGRLVEMSKPLRPSHDAAV